MPNLDRQVLRSYLKTLCHRFSSDDAWRGVVWYNVTQIQPKELNAGFRACWNSEHLVFNRVCGSFLWAMHRQETASWNCRVERLLLRSGRVILVALDWLSVP